MPKAKAKPLVSVSFKSLHMDDECCFTNVWIQDDPRNAKWTQVCSHNRRGAFLGYHKDHWVMEVHKTFPSMGS